VTPVFYSAVVSTERQDELIPDGRDWVGRRRKVRSASASLEAWTRDSCKEIVRYQAVVIDSALLDSPTGVDWPACILPPKYTRVLGAFILHEFFPTHNQVPMPPYFLPGNPTACATRASSSDVTITGPSHC